MTEPSNIRSGRTIGRHGLLRDLNYRAVYERLAQEGPSSRAELARVLDLSAASVGRIVEGLLKADLVHEGERVTAGVGRPQTLLHLNAQAGLVAGVSIRSKSIRLHLADLAGDILSREVADRTDESAQALAVQVRDLILTAREIHAPAVDLASVVVGLSGVWDETQRQVYAAPNLSVLEGADAQAVLREALTGHLPPGALRVDNDINFAALGEWEFGAARNTDNFFYLSLGSGVGGATVVSGSLYRGTEGFAGELGYLQIHVDGELRSLEKVIGRNGLERFAARAGLPIPDGEVFSYLANQASGDDVIGNYVSEALSQALVAVVVALNPQMIVLGGGVGRYGANWIERIRHRLASFIPVIPTIVSTELGREASLLGAVGFGRVLARDALLSREIAG